jgi:type VI secretion system protein ImpG
MGAAVPAALNRSPMDELLPHYERELALLRRSVHDFAARYPKIAARLGLTDGEIADPHVDRLLQTFALLGARISARLDDDYPQFSKALIDTLFPEQLRPIPSCSIAQFHAGTASSQLTAPLTVLRGTELEDRSGACRFRTVYEVTLAPIMIKAVHVVPASAASPTRQLPSNTSILLSITFESLTDETAFRDAMPDRLRLHLHGTPTLVAALTDALLLHVPKAFIESGPNDRWKALAKVPLAAAGYDEQDALIPHSGQAHAPWRLLREYFAFPDKFAFVDLDIAMLVRAAGPCRQMTLHLPVVDVPEATAIRSQLDTVTLHHFQLGCTPIVNAFGRDAVPVTLTPETTTYAVAPHVLSMRDITVRSVDTVRWTKDLSPEVVDGMPLSPYRGFVHRHASNTAPVYWLACDQAEKRDARHRAKITLVDLDGQPAPQAIGQLLIRLTCTNGNFPKTLPVGHPEGDLHNETENLPGPVSLLRTPSSVHPSPTTHGTLWQLIAGLSPHVLVLQSVSVGTLKELLRLLSSDIAESRALVDAITDVSHKSVMQWLSIPPMPTFVRGLEITVTIERSVLATVSLYACSRLLDPFFAHFAPANGYVQCVIREAGSNRVLIRALPHLGTSPML